MNCTWILVANAAQARLFEQQPGRPLALLQVFSHPESRLRSSELGDDEAGRELPNRAFGGAAFEPRLSAKRKEHLLFAQELGWHLEQAAQEGRYAALTVFASSPFLGELKQALGDATRRLLAATRDVDLSSVGFAEMERRIRHELEESKLSST